MDNNKSAHSASSGQGNFFSGFLLGALIGGAVVFLLGTKKGKRILKTISEEGAENISSILDKIDKTDLQDELSEDDSISDENLSSRETVVEDKPKAKRFFRGISKRVN